MRDGSDFSRHITAIISPYAQRHGSVGQVGRERLEEDHLPANLPDFGKLLQFSFERSLYFLKRLLSFGLSP